MSRYDRTEKLQTLVRLLSHREERAKRQLAQRQRAVDGAQSRADELGGLAREYRARMENTSHAGIPAGDLQLWRRFNQSLEEVVQMQSLQVEKLRSELEQAQSECLAALVRRRGGERLEEAQQRRDSDRSRRRDRVSAPERVPRRDPEL